MDLPLFKGVGADHVTSFLEKTGIEFHKFSPGDVIVSGGEPVKSLKFLISGKIRINAEALKGRVVVSSVFEGHEALGATRLFGLHPHYDATVVAMDNVGIMEFSKEKYVSLLQSDSIYTMNFANLLSMNVQKTMETLSRFTRLDLSRVFAEWLVLFTGRKSEDIRINGVEALCDIYGKEFVDSALVRLAAHSLVSVEGEEILVDDRDALIEYVIDRGIYAEKAT